MSEINAQGFLITLAVVPWNINRLYDSAKKRWTDKIWAMGLTFIKAAQLSYMGVWGEGKKSRSTILFFWLEIETSLVYGKIGSDR